MDFYTPLSVLDCELMNGGTRAQGPEQLDRITRGECINLADFLDVGEQTSRRWFRVPTVPGGPLPPYRRLVPITQRPGHPNDPHAVGRSIYSMYGDPSEPDDDEEYSIQAKSIEELRFRCLLGATMGDDEGLTRDGVYHGASFNIHLDFVFLSDALELGVDALIQGHWGSPENGGDEDGHAEFFRFAWYRIRLLYLDPINRDFGAKWRVMVRLNRPHPIIDYREE